MPIYSSPAALSRTAASIFLIALITVTPLPANAGQLQPTSSNAHERQMSPVATGALAEHPSRSAASAKTQPVGTGKLDLLEFPDMAGYEPLHGLFVFGGTAKALNGKWHPAPTRFTYQWLSNGRPIPGATASTYTIPQMVVETSLSLRVSAHRTDYESYVYTTLGRPVVQSTEPPLIVVPPVPTGAFSDVPADMQFSKEIKWMAVEGISTGWTDNTFRPLEAVARDAMSAFMYRLAGQPHFTPPRTSPFRDVVRTQQFYKEMSWLSKTGVSTGWDDGTYRPLSAVNRDAMAAFMYRLAGSPAYAPPKKSPFIDVSTSNQFYKEISWLAAQGISTGWKQPNGTSAFRPSEPVRRDAMAAFMYRLDQKGYKLPAAS